jgi:hypothetical protein
MRPSEQPMIPSRCLLAGLLTGIVTALVVVVFNVVYRNVQDLIAYDIVMPVSIFLAFPLINLIAGGAFFLFVTHLRNGIAIYKTTVLSVMIVLALFTVFTGKTENSTEEKFRGLLLGLELIEGLLAAFLIPFFANHPKLFLTDKDIKGEE